MADIVKRLKYFTGQFLQQQDFTDEQEYLLDRTRRHNAQLHTPGIAKGLTVTVNSGSKSVSVAAGTALDGEGQLIVLKDPFNVGFESEFHGNTVLVVISYHEEPSDESTVGDVGMTRWLERPEIRVFKESQAPSADLSIRLARLQLDINGNITSHDTSVRTPSGAKVLPHETFESLRLSRQGVNPNQWPVLTSGAAQQADLAGNLSVNGNILVTGTVDGRDVSADAATNQAHRDNTNNPHGVTAAQVGAIASVAGMTSPGGNIAVTGSNGITVTTNAGTKTVNVAGGSPISIAGVSNAGGNIPINGSGGISVGTAGGAINISTSAAAIGALPAGDYLKRSLAWVAFSPSDADFATRTISLGFEPKQIWVTGRAYAQLTSSSPEGLYGGVTGGLCRVTGPGSFHQEGFESHVRRFPMNTCTFGNPFTWSMNQHWLSGVGGLYCDDRYSNPRQRVSLKVYISSVGADSFVLTFRRDHQGFAQPYSFYMELYITTLG